LLGEKPGVCFAGQLLADLLEGQCPHIAVGLLEQLPDHFQHRILGAGLLPTGDRAPQGQPEKEQEQQSWAIECRLR